MQQEAVCECKWFEICSGSILWEEMR